MFDSWYLVWGWPCKWKWKIGGLSKILYSSLPTQTHRTQRQGHTEHTDTDTQNTHTNTETQKQSLKWIMAIFFTFAL